MNKARHEGVMQLLQSAWQRKEQKFYLLIPGLLLQEQGWISEQLIGDKVLVFGHNIIFISACYQAAGVIVLVECDNKYIIVYCICIHVYVYIINV